jgi:hypothetical protein
MREAEEDRQSAAERDRGQGDHGAYRSRKAADAYASRHPHRRMLAYLSFVRERTGVTTTRARTQPALVEKRAIYSRFSTSAQIRGHPSAQRSAPDAH